MGYKNILVPLDGSSFAKRAIGEAVKVACGKDARIILLGVVELPPAVFEGYSEFAVNVEASEQLKDRITVFLKGEVATLEKDGFTAEVIVRQGFPSDEIDEVANEEKVDLIVMTTHGRRGFAHFLLGSVAEKVVRTAPCSVLIMRPSKEERYILESRQ